jgi:hypothetical protein
MFLTVAGWWPIQIRTMTSTDLSKAFIFYIQQATQDSASKYIVIVQPMLFTFLSLANAGLQPQKPVFRVSLVLVGFVVDKVPLR